MSITNAEITLNVIAELFGGLWFPGNAIAMNYFKAYGFVTTSHTIAFAQDLPHWMTRVGRVRTLSASSNTRIELDTLYMANDLGDPRVMSPRTDEQRVVEELCQLADLN